MSKKRKYNLPTFVKPYQNGEYQVVIMRKHLKYTKCGFATPQAAHEHALEVLEQAAEKVIGQDVVVIGYECMECGYSEPGFFSKCPKCGSYHTVKACKKDADEVMQEHCPQETKLFEPASPVQSCGNCIHAGICRLKHENLTPLVAIMQQLSSKLDVSAVRQIMGFYCKHYQRKIIDS